MRAAKLTRVRAAAAAAALAILALFAFGPATAAQAGTTVPAEAGTALTANSFVPIKGAGSTYAYPALDQWAVDMQPQGLHVDFNPNGSAQGRAQYIEDQEDFAGSDIAFVTNGDPDPFEGVDDSSLQFAYSYIPDVAGGLSFMYNLQVGGQKITNMRLSGKTLAEIFTGHITNWDNPAITHDYGRQLPSIPITAVTRSDGAGESYFLSRWLDTEYRSLWVPFCVAHGGQPNCGTGPTELYPGLGKSLSGSDTLSQYISTSSNNGAIGYAEQAYAQEYHLPTVQMLNAAGYYVGPTAPNVAIALEKAQINPDESSVNFLMQNLNNVYTDKDPRAYPLSSYSYLIVPRTSRTISGHTWGPISEFNRSKGVALSSYVNFILCGAQATAAQLGYSPLPGPMVTGGFRQEAYIPGGVKSPAASNYDSCNNPAFYHGKDTVTATAPYPSACQKASAPLDCVVVDGKPTNAGGGGAGGGGGSGGGAGSGGNGTGGNGAGGAGATNCPSTPAATPTAASSTSSKTGKSPSAAPTPSSTCTPGAGSGASVNPNTGAVTGGTTGANADVYAQPVGLAGNPSSQLTFGILTGLELLAAIAVPAGLGTWLQQTRRKRRLPGGPPPSANGFPPPGYTQPPAPGTPPLPPAPASPPDGDPASPPTAPDMPRPGLDSPPTGLIPPGQNGDAG